MAFVGPSTWLDEQEPTEVDTHNRLKAKLEIIYTPTIKTSKQIINKIQTIKYCPDKTVEELISDIDKIVARTRLEKNLDPILRRHEDMAIEKSAKMHRKLANQCVRLERELEQQRQLTNLKLDAQKIWANSDDTKEKDHTPIKEESNGSTSACPEARRNWNAHERHWQQKDIPPDEKYESRLELAKSTGWFTGEVQILPNASSTEPRGSAAEFDDECTFMYPVLNSSINGLTATVNNNEVDTEPANETLLQGFPENLNNKEIIRPDVFQTHEEAMLIRYSPNQTNTDISSEFGILQNG
ncbi:hypothetical protein BDD12DRAFT_810866 [Trichophaea hybrida]|nr:hypothetical protein BDD12DRAFT_810866 [Trichophaea hybrida]